MESTEATQGSPEIKALNYPPELESENYRAWAKALRASYQTLVGASLGEEIDAASEASLPQVLFDAPFVLLSHGVQADPIFCFANRMAMALFGYDWASFTKLPSRFSAEPDNRAVRAQLLEQVREQGYISNYSGVRIAADGRRFEIKKATVWNLFDDAGRRIGQAACFASWLDL